MQFKTIEWFPFRWSLIVARGSVWRLHFHCATVPWRHQFSLRRYLCKHFVSSPQSAPAEASLSVIKCMALCGKWGCILNLDAVKVFFFNVNTVIHDTKSKIRSPGKPRQNRFKALNWEVTLIFLFIIRNGIKGVVLLDLKWKADPLSIRRDLTVGQKSSNVNEKMDSFTVCWNQTVPVCQE